MKKALNRIFPTTAPDASPEAPVAGVTTAPPPGVERACPDCGTPAEASQDWCLECGARIEQPTAKWHQPVAIMASVALIFVAAIALALSEVAKDAEIAKAKTVKRYVAAPPPPAATTPPQPAEPTPSDDAPTPDTSDNPTDDKGPDPATTDDPSAATDPGTSPDSGLTDTSGGGYVPPTSGTPTTPAPPPEAEAWPEGKKAWTVILLSTTSKDEANELALKARKDGVPAGILKSDDYKNLSSGLWMVWAGRFGSEDEAFNAATDYSSKGYDGESVEYVRNKAAAGDTTDDSSDDPSDDSSNGG